MAKIIGSRGKASGPKLVKQIDLAEVRLLTREVKELQKYLQEKHQAIREALENGPHGLT